MKDETPDPSALDSLERGLAKVQDPDDAARTLDELEIAEEDESPLDQTPGTEQAADELAAVARRVESESDSTQPKLDAAIFEAANADEVPAATREGRNRLRTELMHRLAPFDAVDAWLFTQINELPHPAFLNRSMSRLTWVMTGGHAWTAIVAITVIAGGSRRWPVAGRVLPALWLTTWLVEYPIKRFFRRRRPFVAIVQAIVLGRKPGSYSFPSGHSAAAFAGAALLATEFPRARRVFFLVAALTGFSRVYLGAHYPGDVAIGSAVGIGLSRTFRALFRRILPRFLR